MNISRVLRRLVYTPIVASTCQTCLAQMWPSPFLDEITPCFPDSFSSRGIWLNHGGAFGAPTSSWTYSFAINTNIYFDGPSCPQSVLTIAPQPLGCIDFDPVSGRLFGGEYVDDNFARIYRFGPPPAMWDTGFIPSLTTSLYFIRDNDRDKWDGLAVDSDQSLWLSFDLGWHVYHVNSSGADRPGSFILPFGNSGVEVSGNFLLLANPQEQRVHLYSKGGRYPVGFFASNPPNNPFSPGLLEDLDVSSVGTQTILAGRSTINTDTFIRYNITQMVSDTDGDGIPGSSPGIPYVSDNCPTVSNPNQSDVNGDGIGDACQSITNDADGDGIADRLDNCVNSYNPVQIDTDADGIGDACDPAALCLSSEVRFTSQSTLVDVLMADLDGDGDDELITLHHKSYSEGGDAGMVSIRWAGTHGAIGPYSEEVEYGAGEQPIAIAVGDFTRDGLKDIAVLQAKDFGTPNIPAGVTILIGDGNFHFGELRHFDLPLVNGAEVTPVDMVAMNLDTFGGSPSDGLVVLLSSPHRLLVITNCSLCQHPTVVPQFSPIPPAASAEFSYTPKKAAVGNIATFAGEDPVRLDLAFTDSSNGVHVRSWSTSAAPYLQSVSDYTMASSPIRDIAVARLRTTTPLADVVVSFDNTRNIQVLVNNGSGGLFLLSQSTQEIISAQNDPAGKILSMLAVPFMLCDQCSFPTVDGLAFLIQRKDNPNTGTNRFVLIATSKNATASPFVDLPGRTESPVFFNSVSDQVLTCGDFNRNGIVDCVVVERQSGGRAATSLVPDGVNAGIGTFARTTFREPQSVAIADVNGGGKDLIVANRFGQGSNLGNIEVFPQQSGVPGRFLLTSSETIAAPNSGNVFSVAAVDLNSDGYADVLISYRDPISGVAYVASYVRNLTGTAFTLKSTQPMYDSVNCGGTPCSLGDPLNLAAADIDGDGYPDAVSLVTGGFRNLYVARGRDGGNVAPAAVMSLPGTTGYFLGPVSEAHPSGPALAVRDLNCDGRPDLITANSTQGNITILTNLSQPGAPAFSGRQDIALPNGGSQPISVACGSFTGALGPFIAVADVQFDQAIVFRRGTNGYSGGSYDVYPVGRQPRSLVAVDLDADGDDDLIVAERLDSTLSILANRGDGTFVRSSTIGTGTTIRFVATADIDGNGSAEIIEIGGSGAASFVRVNAGNCVSSPSQALCLKGDVNGDGVVDGRDIQGFVNVFRAPNSATDQQRCAADMTGNSSIEASDTPLFVCKLVGDGICDACPLDDSLRPPGPPLFDDCNGNGVPDGDDIAGGLLHDCNANGFPDECGEPDCNHNGVPDDCDIAGGTSQDCNDNGLPDECDLSLPPPAGSLDCNANGIPDECDIAAGRCQDANANGLCDECESGPYGRGSSGHGLQDASAAGLAESEDGSAASSAARCAGEWNEADAWDAFFEWSVQQEWGAGSGISGEEQFRRMADKLEELGLPLEDPRLRFFGGQP